MGLLTFTYKGREFSYEDHNHNATRDNERGVELALAKEFLGKCSNVVEIGAVTPYYFGEYTHPVYDLTDRHPRAIQQDASGFDAAGKDLLSISTIEHFSNGRATQFIDSVILNAKHYLITWPLGYNKELDSYSNPHVRYMSRIDPASREDKDKDNWIEKKELSDIDKKYGTYQWANTIAVVENFI